MAFPSNIDMTSVRLKLLETLHCHYSLQQTCDTFTTPEYSNAKTLYLPQIPTLSNTTNYGFELDS